MRYSFACIYASLNDDDFFKKNLLSKSRSGPTFCQFHLFSFRYFYSNLAVPRGCLQFVIVVFPDHTHLLFLINILVCCSFLITLRPTCITLANVNAPVVATTSWWWHFYALVMA